MILTTERLDLREIKASDWQAIFAYQSDPHYRRYYPWSQDLQADVQRGAFGDSYGPTETFL